MSVFDRWSGRFANVAAAWPILVPASLAGAITAILASGAKWLANLGPFGWWIAALVAFVLSAIGILAGVEAKRKLDILRATRRWLNDVDSINPLEDTFIRKRINISDLYDPDKRIIEGKTFKDCQLVGPQNLMLVGGTISHCGFGMCDFSVARDGAFLQNAIMFKDCNVIGGDIIRVTFFLPPAHAQHMQGMGMNFIT